MKNLTAAKWLLVAVSLLGSVASYLGKQDVMLRLSMILTILISTVLIVLIVDHLPSLFARKALIALGMLATAIEAIVAIGTSDWVQISISLILPAFFLIKWLFSKEGA